MLLWLGHRLWVENAPQGQIEPSGAIIQGNSLLPISPLIYPEYRVYGDLVSDIIECESGGKHEGVWGKANEYGIAQFMEKTFYWLAEKSELQNPDWKNKDQQIWLLNWSLQNGYQNKWTCYNIVKGR